MKKIFTLFALLVCFAAQLSAQIKVTINNKEVDLSKTETFTFNLYYDDEIFYTIAGYPMLDPTFTNTSDEAIELGVDVKTSSTDKAFFGVCGMNIGNCMPLTTYNYKDHLVKLAPGDSISLALHFDTEQGDYRTANANIFVEADGEKIANFVMKYVYNETTEGVNDVKANAASVKVVGNELVYSFAAAGANSVSLYALDGKMVKHIAAAGKNGSVNLAGLQPGVYVCKANGNSSKVVVK